MSTADRLRPSIPRSGNMEPDRLTEIIAKLIEHPELGTAADRARVLRLAIAIGLPDDLAARLAATMPADQVAELKAYLATGQDWDGETIAETLRRLEGIE